MKKKQNTEKQITLPTQRRHVNCLDAFMVDDIYIAKSPPDSDNKEPCTPTHCH